MLFFFTGWTSSVLLVALDGFDVLFCFFPLSSECARLVLFLPLGVLLSCSVL